MKYNVVCEANNTERILEDCHNIPKALAVEYLTSRYDSVVKYSENISDYFTNDDLLYFFVEINGVKCTYKIVESEESKKAREDESLSELVKTKYIVKKHLYNFLKN